MYIGWRSGDTLSLGKDVVDFTVGRAPFQLGHGFLVYDGAAEGGSRGGYWTNARKAFQFAAIGRFKPGKHKVEVFYLDKDELPEADSGSRLFGLNYEYAFNDSSSVGATYMKGMAHKDIRPGRDGLNVYDFRAFVTPIPSAKDFSLEAEYAREDNGVALDSNGWTCRAPMSSVASPGNRRSPIATRSSRATTRTRRSNEAFDPLFLGFNDWGTWWQGEIAGEYFLSNSNLISHELRVQRARLRRSARA